ncbi:MAG TPA: discoidin domain-containing protein [Gemmatimonadales bacterium]|nr:discoidin domain-containing protein [Gemmatimonadales bacterium]
MPAIGLPSTRPRPPRARLATAVALLALAGCRSGPPVLDHQAILARQAWWENRDFDWYRREIPFFESPDTAIDATYYYRWELLTRHLTYGSPESGYTFTEFIDRPFWSGAYGAISCPLGHQMYEARWLKDRRYVEDFARYWFETPGAEPRSYSNWYGDAVWASYLVTGDSAFLRTMLPHMVTQYQGWVTEHWDPDHRMFRWDGMHDGMETNINSRQTADSFAGAEGYRPTLNSYLFADARAIARAAALLGDSALASEYAGRAARLKARVQEELWDPGREFFLHQFAHDEPRGVRAKSRTYQTGPFAGTPHGRELIGYVPWQFSLPDSGYEGAWRFLMDTSYFAAPFGPTTVERHDPQFLVSKVCCVWSGNAWPYATSQTLTAMANLLNEYRQQVVTREDYVRLLRGFALDQRKNGRPYIAEAADPESGSWEGHDTYYHSEHYFHSGFIDQVITGLAGLRPRGDDTLEVNPLIPDGWDWFALDEVSYRGRRVSIFWDRDGTHYRGGTGLSLYVDGRRVAQSDSLARLTAAMGVAPPQAPVERPVNFAVNNGRGAFPSVTASYSAPGTPPHFLVDGNAWYDRSPPNRWTAAGSGNATDWVALDFGVVRPVEWVTLHFLDDGDSLRAPASYELEAWKDGAWSAIAGQQRVPGHPEGRRANTVRFARIETSKLRLVLTHRPGATSGLTEIEAWAHAEPPFSAANEASGNVAINPAGQGYPAVSASWTATGSRPEEAIDGRIWYTRYSRNRWSTSGTRHPSDWLAVDFGAPRRVGRVEVHFVADGRGLAAPRDYHVEYWSGGAWVAAVVRRRLPERPEGSALNTVWIEPVETTRVRIVVDHAAPAATAITEVLVWREES